MSFKVLCWDTSDQGSAGVSNALRFATKEEGEKYGFDLSMRWTALVRYSVAESADPVNYVWRDGRAIAYCECQCGCNLDRTHNNTCEECANGRHHAGKNLREVLA